MAYVLISSGKFCTTCKHMKKTVDETPVCKLFADDMSGILAPLHVARNDSNRCGTEGKLWEQKSQRNKK
jgi:hypothetical protein